MRDTHPYRYFDFLIIFCFIQFYYLNLPLKLNA